MSFPFGTERVADARENRTANRYATAPNSTTPPPHRAPCLPARPALALLAQDGRDRWSVPPGVPVAGPVPASLGGATATLAD
jgi:hypothetical protein